MDNPKVLIVMGSESDLPVMEEAARALAELGVSHQLRVASAHRTPEKAAAIARDARAKGAKVLIAGAGMAAHLAGALAAQTTLPVIGVPLEGGAPGGIDALLSTVQMPPGMPVATVAIGRAGARNAGILAAEILAVADEALARKLDGLRRTMAEKAEAADRKLQK